MKHKKAKNFFKSLEKNQFLSVYVIKHCSPRVKTVLRKNRLRSIDDLILYKSTHNGFKSLPGAGPKAQLELDSLLSQYMMDEINDGSNAVVKLNARMSRKALNAISKICKPASPCAVTFILASFTIDRLTSQLKPINFLDINGVGLKTSDELIAFRNELSSVLTTRFEELWS